MSYTKSLKAISIMEIEEVIAKAISDLTGTETSATISSFVGNTNFTDNCSGKDTFRFDLSLRVNRSYSSGTESSDIPF